MTTSVNWADELIEQLEFHWDRQLRPRLEGLDDDEYFWEPVEGCWSVRRRSDPGAPIRAGSGDFVVDFEIPEPSIPPVTTIAWRLSHLIVGVFGERAAHHFNAPPMDYETWAYAGTAAEALAQLDAAYSSWMDGVRSLGDEGMARPCGPAEGPYADAPLAKLVLHINREAIHHGAEIALLRDLYAHRS